MTTASSPPTIASTATLAVWLLPAILDREGPDPDGIARVLFHVTMRVEGKDASFAELSSFAHDGAGWRYVGGVTRACRVDRARDLTIAAFARPA